MFYYNNAYRIYKDAKYGASYQLQELLLSKFRGTNKPAYRLNIKDNKFNIGEAFTNNKAIKVAYQEHTDLREIKTEVETKTIIERGLVTNIITPLDIISIALQDNRSNIQKKLSKQITASASLLLNKGKRPQA